MRMSQEFTKMMLGEDYEITEEMGDIEALQGVSQFPARIKCATLAWKALEKGTVEKKVRQNKFSGLQPLTMCNIPFTLGSNNKIKV